MVMEVAHFSRSDDGSFVPARFAQSHWGDDHLNGPAVVGLSARALEGACGDPEFQPARLTVDLFRAARGVPTTVSVRTLRDGRRVRNAECDVVQDGLVVAHAILVQYRRSAPPPGELWTASRPAVPMPAADDPALTYVASEEGDRSRSPAAHQNTSRKISYTKSISVVAGESNSPFVRAAMAAEGTSLVTNLGTKGIGYINGDVTVALSRLPVGEWIGVQADSHWAADGVAVGTSTLFDADGACGSGMTTAVANPAAQIDFSDNPFPERTPQR